MRAGWRSRGTQTQAKFFSKKGAALRFLFKKPITQNEKKRYNEYNDNAQFAAAGAELRLLRRLRFHFRWEEEYVCCQRYCHVQVIGNL